MFSTLFKGLDIQPFHCDICECAKHTCVSVLISNKKSSSPFFLVHSDMWGPSTILNISGSRLFVTFIDDCTRVSWIYLLKNKSDVSHIFPIFCTMVQKSRKFARTMLMIISIKFCLSGFKRNESYMNHLVSPLPNKMGVMERKNRHLLECTRALLFQQNVPKSYWGEAVLTSAYVKQYSF